MIDFYIINRSQTTAQSHHAYVHPHTHKWSTSTPSTNQSMTITLIKWFTYEGIHSLPSNRQQRMYIRIIYTTYGIYCVYTYRHKLHAHLYLFTSTCTIEPYLSIQANGEGHHPHHAPINSSMNITYT